MKNVCNKNAQKVALDRIVNNSRYVCVCVRVWQQNKYKFLKMK